MICCRRAVTRDALELPQPSILDERHRRLTLRLVWQELRPCAANVAEAVLSVRGGLQRFGLVRLNGLRRGTACASCWWPHASAHNHHRLPTRAAPDGARRCRGAIRRWSSLHQLQQSQRAPRVVVQNAEVAGPLQALGQDMLQQQPQEVFCGQGVRGRPAALGIAPAVGDLAALAAQDVALGDHASVDIAPQIAQRLLSITHGFAVHHPLRGQVRRQRQPRRVQRGLELARKHLGQGLLAEEVAAARRLSLTRGLAQLHFGAPQPGLGIKGSRRDAHMHMRMEAQSAVVGVQHRHRAGCAAQGLVGLRKGLERGPGRLHHQAIDHALMRPSQMAKLRRQREGHQEVGGGHQSLELTLQPECGVMVLAVRAGAVAAGVRQHGVCGAARASGQHLRCKAAAAGLKRAQRLQVAGQQARAVLLPQGGLKLSDEVSQPHHDAAPTPMRY